jgi:hypothetical protein
MRNKTSLKLFETRVQVHGQIVIFIPKGNTAFGEEILESKRENHHD